VTDKTEVVGFKVDKQNKDMNKILKKWTNTKEINKNLMKWTHSSNFVKKKCEMIFIPRFSLECILLKQNMSSIIQMFSSTTKRFLPHYFGPKLYNTEKQKFYKKLIFKYLQHCT
jgi:hypothetical protein